MRPASGDHRGEVYGGVPRNPLRVPSVVIGYVYFLRARSVGYEGDLGREYAFFAGKPFHQIVGEAVGYGNGAAGLSDVPCANISLSFIMSNTRNSAVSLSFVVLIPLSRGVPYRAPEGEVYGPLRRCLYPEVRGRLLFLSRQRGRKSPCRRLWCSDFGFERLEPFFPRRP